MKHHIDRAKAALGELGGLSAKTDAAEANILKAAEKRLAEVQKSLSRMQKGIESAPKNEQDRYVELVEERGQLNLVISRSRALLGS